MDLILLLLIMFMLSFLAINYDADKGLGEHDYVKINQLLEGKDNISGDWQSLDYIGIILQKTHIELYHYSFGSINKIGKFTSVDELLKSSMIDQKRTYVIYEQESTHYLGSIIRGFSMLNIPIGIAQAGL